MPARAQYPVGVLTVRPEKESTDWSKDTLKERKWGVKGVLVDRSDGHGLVYQIRHNDGTTGWYEPRELKRLDATGEALPGDLDRGNDGMQEL